MGECVSFIFNEHSDRKVGHICDHSTALSTSIRSAGVVCATRVRAVFDSSAWRFTLIFCSLRPKPLGRSFFAFLFPHVPLVPSIPSDVSESGQDPVQDAEMFPSDEALSQRLLWVCLLMLLGWSVLGLAAFLPLYMVNTPCLAHSIPPPRFSGAYSLLQDLSLLRLLRLLDNESITTTSAFILPFSAREIVDGGDKAPEARTRLIIATVLAIVLGVLPILWKILHEFNKLVAYRRIWTEVHCQGLELGWLSTRAAPGFLGWGEKRIKEFIVKAGLSSTLEPTENGNGNGRSRRRRRAQEWNSEERAHLEVDVRNLFSVG